MTRSIRRNQVSGTSSSNKGAIGSKVCSKYPKTKKNLISIIEAKIDVNKPIIDYVIRDFWGNNTLNADVFYLVNEQHFVKSYITLID